MFVYDVDYYCKNFLIHQIYIHLSMIYPYIFIWLWISIKEESIYNFFKKNVWHSTCLPMKLNG